MFDMVINHMGYGDAQFFHPFNASSDFHDCNGELQLQLQLKGAAQPACCCCCSCCYFKVQAKDSVPQVAAVTVAGSTWQRSVVVVSLLRQAVVQDMPLLPEVQRVL